MNIHVVSLQVPYPADYGGAIDIFYKLKELRNEGFQIILHTYIYGREESPVLAQLCHEVHYYKRSSGFGKQLSLLPYIVNTRTDKRLLDDLCRDDVPILFEGLHTCYLLDHPALRNRRKIVRMHNIEHKYYWQLAKQNPWSWKAIYYTIESLRLRWFEQKLKHASLICAITKADKQELGRRYSTTEVIHLPCFFDAEFPETPQKTEPFVLYHGNLSVEENRRTAKYILEKIAPKMPHVLFVIAGHNPDFKRIPQNAKVIDNPTDEYLLQLISTAHIHLMLTFQPTGIKLKLLNALVKGNGHIIANHDMLYGHSLGRFCTRADSTKEIVSSIERLMKESMEPEELDLRKRIILKMKKAGISRLSLFNRY